MKSWTWTSARMLAVVVAVAAVAAVAVTLMSTGSALAGKGGNKGGGGGGGGAPNFAFAFQARSLYLTTIDDGHRVRLTNPPKDSSDQGPAWSFDLDPDTPGYQGAVAFLRRAWPVVDLCVANPDDSSVVVVQSFRYPNDPIPFGTNSFEKLVWSPSGREIICYCSRNDDPEFPLPSGLYAVDVLNGGYRYFADGFSLTISKVRGQMAFNRSGLGIWTADFTFDGNGLLVIDTASYQQIIPSGVGSAWSPDGQFLAYLNASARALTVLDVATGSEMIVIVFEQESNRLNPTWSPDGLQIAFEYGADIIRITDWWDPSNRQVLLVTDTKKHELKPDWNPGWIAP